MMENGADEKTGTNKALACSHRLFQRKHWLHGNVISTTCCDCGAGFWSHFSECYIWTHIPRWYVDKLDTM